MQQYEAINKNCMIITFVSAREYLCNQIFWVPLSFPEFIMVFLFVLWPLWLSSTNDFIVPVWLLGTRNVWMTMNSFSLSQCEYSAPSLIHSELAQVDCKGLSTPIPVFRWPLSTVRVHMWLVGCHNHGLNSYIVPARGRTAPEPAQIFLIRHIPPSLGNTAYFLNMLTNHSESLSRFIALGLRLFTLNLQEPVY